MKQDPPSQAVLDVIRTAGFAVRTRRTPDQPFRVEAADPASDERFVVTGDDPYRVACELARQARIELEYGERHGTAPHIQVRRLRRDRGAPVGGGHQDQLSPG